MTMPEMPTSLQQRVRTLRWILPLGLGVITVLYEIGPGRWIHDQYSISAYFDLDILFYGLVVPLVTFVGLTLLMRWLDAKERAERQAHTSEQRLASILAASADAIIGLDEIGHIDSWNHGEELLLGYLPTAIQGKTLAALLGRGEASEMEANWLKWNVQTTGFLRGHETTCKDIKGRQIEVELTATHLTDAAGHSLGMSVILRDVTDRKHRDAEIRRLNVNLHEQIAERTRELAEKVQQLAHANDDLQQLDKMRTEFVSVATHQIRAPLTNMRGAFERMEGNCPAINATCARMFVILAQQAERLDRLVKDVLSAARIEAGELLLQTEPGSALPIVQEVVEQIKVGRADRPGRISTKPGLALMFADRHHVGEILVNLLANADTYSPRGREIMVDVRADEVEWTIAVQDAGNGLAPRDLQRVFEKFYRADGSDSQSAYGYGLCLYVCPLLVEAH